MSFRPLHDRVLVRRVKEEEKTKGGIIIPDTAKEKPQEGKIVAVGTGIRGEDGKVTLSHRAVHTQTLTGEMPEEKIAPKERKF